MSITVNWDNEDRQLIIWKAEGTWTWDDFRVAQAELNRMLDSVPHNVHVIADVRRAPMVPRDAFANFKRLERDANPRLDRIVVVGGSVLVRALVTTFNEVSRHRPTCFELAETIEEARAMLAVQEKTT